MVNIAEKDSLPETLDAVREVWDSIARFGYAIIRDIDLGLHPSIRAHFGERYFDRGVLVSDHVEIHKDRDRARDVVRYEWQDGGLSLAEYHTVTIENRGNYVGARDHKRVEVLDDPRSVEWVAAVLNLVPPNCRQRVGTFGINFFRTRSTVVWGPHHDNEEFCLVYVVSKAGEGAETRLHNPDEHLTVVLRHTPVPGEVLIFRDAQYLHDVTPLHDFDAAACQRDAVVCTVNYRDTYPV